MFMFMWVMKNKNDLMKITRNEDTKSNDDIKNSTSVLREEKINFVYWTVGKSVIREKRRFYRYVIKIPTIDKWN